MFSRFRQNVAKIASKISRLRARFEAFKANFLHRKPKIRVHQATPTDPIPHKP